MLTFTKMNGAGNDFVMLDNRKGALRLDRQMIARLCDRHRGVGADGVLMVEPATGEADFRMRYYNADGGEAEMCGNGARCFARYLNHLDGARERVRFETLAGIITAECVGENVRIEMNEPKDLVIGEKLVVDSAELTVHSINTGVPHAVVMVENLETVPVQQLGAAIRCHNRFAPKGTNANFVGLMADGAIAIRTYERGVEGETLACGTGVVASALIFHELTGAPAPIAVLVRGGDRLEVGFEKTPRGYANPTLTGPADFVFDGQIAL